jgi:hypothetical protein
MSTTKASIQLFLCVLVGAAWGCSEPPEAWSPVLEETSTAFLETQTERVMEDVQGALNHLHTDPTRAENALLQAERSLGYMTDFYLPLFRARERAYNAFRFFRLGEHGRVVGELNAIEKTLATMVQNPESGPLEELQSLAEAVADARVAVEAGPDQGGAALENLARKLNQAVLKGDLILR